MCMSHSSQDEPSGLIYIYAYKTCPKDWVDALLEGPSLKDCRLELELAGHYCVLQESFAKVFVHPHQWDAVMDALQHCPKLQRTSVIVADGFEHLLRATVNQLRSRVRPKFKARTLLTRTTLEAVIAKANADKAEHNLYGGVVEVDDPYEHEFATVLNSEPSDGETKAKMRRKHKKASRQIARRQIAFKVCADVLFDPKGEISAKSQFFSEMYTDEHLNQRTWTERLSPWNVVPPCDTSAVPLDYVVPVDGIDAATTVYEYSERFRTVPVFQPTLDPVLYATAVALRQYVCDLHNGMPPTPDMLLRASLCKNTENHTGDWLPHVD